MIAGVDTLGFRFEAYGEGAVIVLLGEGIDEGNYRMLSAFAELLREDPPSGYQELVPAYNSCLVVFDPLVAKPSDMLAALRAIASSLGPLADIGPAPIVELPVCYGGEYGPDLAEAAGGAGLTENEYVDLHAGRDYLIYMLGFSPGFPYLGGLDERLARPRLKSPRARVPAGSVGIADRQTGVYPTDSPGGWNLIGRTPLALFDSGRERPALLEAGSLLRFKPITPERFAELRALALSEARAEGSAPPGSRTEADAGLLVLKPGALSIIVDSGRVGFQASGVPPSGPMDEYAMAMANILVGNARGEACIECLLGGMELRFERPAAFALSGASLPAFLDDEPVGRHTTLHARTGSVLRLGMAEEGLRVYCAVRGGFPLMPVMGSRSTFMRGGFGGLNGRALAAGDRLPLAPSALHPAPGASPERSRQCAACRDRVTPAAALPSFKREIILRVIASHDSWRFSERGLRRFYGEAYALSPNSDRMGCRLQGPAVEHAASADIVSSGVQTGTVQVPGDGQPIVLMADRQTTGGYARIAQVIRADLPLLGQARPGQLVRFLAVSIEEAVEALKRREELLTSLDYPLPPALNPRQAAKRFRVTVDGQAFDLNVEELA